jgi:hypothetical protein
MGARYRWGTALVVAVALAAGGGGALYLLKEWEKDSGGAHDGALGADASADAWVARGKGKAVKKGARGGKPRGGGGRIGTRGGGSHAGIGGNAGGGNAGAGNAGAGNAGVDNGGAVDNGGDDDDNDNEEKKPPPFRGRGPAGPTYEAAIASNTQEITIGKQAAPDLTDAQLSGPMRNGAFVGECGAPASMKVTVQVAIKMGRPAGVSVSTSPPDPEIAGCIDRYARTFSWPSSPKMDSFKTTY